MNRQPKVENRRARPLWARAIVLLLCQLVAWQPLAASAGSIVQQPMFTVSSVRANVMLMVDDSSSMQGYRLPVPAGLTAPTGNVTVKYNAGTRTVAGTNEFALRAPAINPLWYNPTVHYAPWNDNNKPVPVATSYPAVAFNFPNADIGGSADVADMNQLTQRDMRYRTPGQRDWVSQARGTVGEGATFQTGIPAVSKWTWNTGVTPNRWDHPLSSPAGLAIYPPIPQEGPQGADLFTNPGTPTCTASPPCVTYTPTFSNQCVATQPVYQNQCTLYQQVQNGTDNVCSQYQQVLTGYQNGACTQYQQVQTGTVCGRWDVVPVPDATSETGFRDTLVCGRTDPVYAQQCVAYAQVPVYQNQCIAYTQVPHYDNVCAQYQQVQTGTQCTQYAQVQTGQTCTAYQNPWTCPPQNVVITADTLTPARYYRYEGPQPGTPAERSTAANYRVIEIDRALGWNGTTQDPAVNRYDVIDPVSGLPSTRSSCAAGSWCTWAEEAQNFANWYAYYRNRLFAAMAVGSQAMSDLTGPEQFMRIGYGRINYFPQGPQPWDVTNLGNRLPATLPALDGTASPPGAIERGVREFATGTPERQALFDWLFSLNWVGSTPNREAVDAVGRYYTRTDSAGPWGDFPGTSNGRAPKDHLWCRRNYTLLATDGEWTRVNPGTTPPPQPLIQNVGVPDPLGQGGTVLNADGAPGPAITGQDKITLSPLNYQYDPAALSEQSYATGSSGQTATLSDVMMYYWSRDLRPQTDPNPLLDIGLRNRMDRIPATASKDGNPAFWQHMSTFVIGYGVNASMDTAANRSAIATGQAVTWPDVGVEDCRITDNDATCTANVPGNRINDTMRGALMSRGDFYAAASPQQLRQGIVSALAQIVAENSSGSALGVSSTSAATGNLVVQASFTTDLWEGSVRAVDSLQLVNFLRGGPPPVDVWQANFAVPASRNILTSTAATTATAFTWGGISVAQQTALGSPAVLDYIRGETAGEQRNGGSFRNRRNTILGDIVNSSPLYSAKANWANHLAPHATRNASPPALPSTTYQGYVTSKQYNSANNTGRVPIVLLGANDGMLHAFDARQTIHANDTAQGFLPGKEIFAYVPRGVYANLSALTQPAYVHKYFVDGQVVEGDVHFGGNENWRTAVVGSAGAGARNLFALDVTDPRAIDTTKVLWDITDAEESDLGHVLGAGVIGSVKDQNAPNGKGKWVYMTGNGYESSANRAVLLMFNMQTGAVEKLDTGVGSAATPNGLGPVAPVYDGNRNIVAAYAGDKLGNLWRFDFADPDHANWTIRKVFVATDASNNPQPITTAPRVVLHPLGGLYVLFGTGKFFEAGDPLDVNVQSVYGLWDKGGTGTIPKTGAGGLAKLVLSNSGVFRAIDKSALDWSTQPGGWYFDMIVGTANGERVVATPILIGGVLQVTSFAPTTQGDPCVPGGLSYIYRLDLASTFGQSVFMNQLPNVVGVIQQPGSVAGSSVFYIGANAGATVASETAASQAQNLGNTGVTAANERAAEAGSCGEVVAFSGVSGGLGGIEAACQQYLPLRTWRPLR